MMLARFVIMCIAAYQWTCFGYDIKSKDVTHAYISFLFGIFYSILATFG